MKNIKIVVACEKSLFCEGMAALLKREDDFELAAVIDRASLISSSLTLRPDVIIVDPLLFGDEDLTRVVQELKARSPRAGILLVFSEKEMSETSLMQYMMKGVDGYIRRTEKLQHVAEAVRTVHAGSIWAERKLLHKFVRYSPLLAPDLDASLSKINPPLTRREMDIVTLLFHGMSNKRISLKLHISEKTVKTHMNNIFKKMKVSNRTEVVSSLVYSH